MIKYEINRERLSFPQVINITVTERCTSHCPFCFKNYNEQDVKADLSIERLLNILCEAAERGCKMVQFSGGEPLLYSNLETAIHRAHILGMETRLSTSGLLLSENKIDSLYTAGLDFCHISLNGASKTTNALTRDNYWETLNAMQLLHEKKKQWVLNWVAYHENIRELQPIIALACKNGAAYIDILSLKGAYQSGITPCTDQDLNTILNVYLNHTDYLHIENCFMSLKTKAGIRSRIQSGCNALRTHMAVDTDGSFMPCPHLKTLKEQEDSIYKYWNESPTAHKLRTLYIDDNRNGEFHRCYANEQQERNY